LASTSRGSSPIDQQAINRLFALTLKKLVIFFSNVVDFNSSFKNMQELREPPSAVSQVATHILVRQEEPPCPLISVDDIKHYKATNFEQFPECFS